MSNEKPVPARTGTVLTEALISDLKDRILLGEEISFDEAMALIEIEDDALFEKLMTSAREITLFYHSNFAHLCSLINAKSNLCAEDCHFCTQSVHFKTDADRYHLLPPNTILEAAKINESQGINTFCLVTSGGSLNDQEFEQILDTVRLLKKHTQLHIDGSLGFLTPERARRLKEAGLRRFNNNLQSSREFYKKIVTTHTYDTRLETLDFLKQEGMDLCSGGILGMGESREDRMKLAFELKPYKPECLPINILSPRKGTPLEAAPKIDPKEIIKTIAVYRFILPKSNIKLAGGREAGLGGYQALALRAGANGMITGGYLTTSGNSFEQDQALLKEAGLEMAAG
ncbi:MAG: biotin synthase BioB [Candidatus Omnitrophica bacterium CG11_big_fil_rev_8_21_14_0_20_45_26]|uniref:Biotin synthase n=1 Tax=Candidatus Abzuiibacterium crystallinum TaxID=1974748 RepID=A0A2H0LMU9_9BACT|nr:MAG: biotin synthase BioB [Candidatus Omnitrophica bacterium CG11_big_fil_rev_8_21_14_0_20_45_26]PIW64227.1 MAG: biotin synthase BioB [Candidatus Omnitrophica bacterium CG12_big_fil_rev_8_21_14_0_65_45_16]